MIVFSDEDLHRGGVSHQNALVISVEMNDTYVRKVLVDTGNNLNLMLFSR